MSAQPSSLPEQSISRAEFARRRNVSSGRVTQWIAEGKIPGSALDGTGPGSRIYETPAVAALRQKLDVSQRTGNGVSTNLVLNGGAPAAPPVLPDNPTASAPSAESLALRPAPTIPDVDPVDEQIKRERLESLQRANRKAAEDEAARAGILTDAEAAAAEIGKAVAEVVMVFEGALPSIATSLSAQFNIPQRDALHLLRSEFRKVRVASAADVKTRAQNLPSLASFEIEDGSAEVEGETEIADA